ncbi:MAG: Nuclease-related protein [Planctomycetaceae bacterium]|nr:Nuclease-related protein [Planctomycetaceae bacterium]
MKFLVILIPALLMVAAAFTIAGVGVLLIRRGGLSKRRSPLTRNLLRPPGHSLRIKIAALDEEFGFLFVIGVSIPVLLYTTHLSQSYLAGEPETAMRTAASIVVCVSVLVYAIFRLVSLTRRRKIAVLGPEGELATGEELNQLMLEGCRVFHDIPFPYGNIDHVVVSQSGVFAVNTKMLGKRRDNDSDATIVVDQQQGIIHFPDRKYHIQTKQFDTERNWLSGYLTSAIG